MLWLLVGVYRVTGIAWTWRKSTKQITELLKLGREFTLRLDYTINRYDTEKPRAHQEVKLLYQLISSLTVFTNVGHRNVPVFLYPCDVLLRL